MKKQLLVTLTFLLSFTTTFAANLYVGRGGSIQQAIDAANPGDTINIAKGRYVENITIPGSKTGLTIMGQGSNKTLIISEGGNLNPKFAPRDVAADIIIDIFAAGVTISNVGIQHPVGGTEKRDIGVFFRPPAVNGRLSRSEVERNRTGNLEPTKPGSRGVLIFRATGISIDNNEFEGNYQDHIHLPTSATKVINNEVEDATRIGIVVIQETDTSLSVDNMIMSNEVSGSGTDGIQIQGDSNSAMNNEVEENAGAGIRLCGPSSSPACVAPGGAVTASYNVVTKNELEDNAGGDVLDFGSNNSVSDNNQD